MGKEYIINDTSYDIKYRQNKEGKWGVNILVVLSEGSMPFTSRIIAPLYFETKAEAEEYAISIIHNHGGWYVM